MSLQALWVAPGDIVTDVSGRFQLPKPGQDGNRLQSNAEQGSAGSATVPFDDPTGDFYPVGLNAFRLKETTSEADDPFLFAGHFGQREEVRGPYRTGTERQVLGTITDANAILERYTIRADESPDRPEESEATRMTWLLGTTAFDIFEADTSMIDTGSTTLTKADFTDYTPASILADMGQQTGKNYFVWWDGTANAGLGGYVLVYAFDSGTHLTSDLRFSNVPADVDDSTTFYAGLDFTLKHDPSRLASYVTVRYAKGRVSANNAATAIEFSRVDKVMDANLVKTAAVASIRATRYTQDLSTEEEILSGTVYLPAAKASQFRAGMRAEMKVIYLTGMSDFVWVRLLNVTLVNISEDPTLTYALAFEGIIATETPPLACAAVIGGLSVQTSANLAGRPVGATITAGTAPYLALVMAAIGSEGFTSEGGFFEADSPWTTETVMPADINGTHFESGTCYQSNGAGAVSFDWVSGVTNPTTDGRIFGLIIPTNATAPAQSVTLDGGGDGSITFGSPPTGLLVLFRVAEGPSGWSGDPLGADWTLLERVDDGLANPNSDLEVWVCCAPEDVGDLNANDAGSSWHAHCLEIPIT